MLGLLRGGDEALRGSAAGGVWKKKNLNQMKKSPQSLSWHKAEPERGDLSDSCSREGLDLKITSKGKERK